MRTLPCPSREDVRNQLLEAIAPYHHGGVVRGYAATPEEVDRVLEIYDTYDVARGAPAEALKGIALSQPLREAIYSGYDFTQTERKLADVRANLMSGIELCPVCGISPPRELDHHLPRSTYHPLAVYVRNLVPLCHDCNQSKSKSAATMAEEQFFHPYLEVIPDVDFLRANVAIENGGLLIDFDIDPDAAVDETTRARLTHVFDRLKLNDRYAREINIFLTSQATAVRMAFASGGAETVRTYLRVQADLERRRFHRNHWQPTLLQALAANAAFCEGGFAQVLPI